MKYLTGKYETLEQLKKDYRAWSKKLHPDVGGSTAEMQILNNEFDYLVTSRIFGKAEQTAKENGFKYTYRENRTPEWVAKIIRDILFDDITIELIGCWVWVTGNTFPHKDALKKAGFEWSGRKKAWYFATTVPTGNAKAKNLGILRDMWGSEVLDDNKKKSNKNPHSKSRKNPDDDAPKSLT